MNTNEQVDKTSTKNSKNNAAFSLSDEKAQLKTIGDQIEAIAKRLEAGGSKVDCEGLYEMGNQIEHFLDADKSSTTSDTSEPAKGWKKQNSNPATPSSFASFDKKAEVDKSKTLDS